MKNYIQIGANIGYDSFFERIQKTRNKVKCFFITEDTRDGMTAYFFTL